MNLKYTVLIEMEAYEDKSAEILRGFYAKEFEKGLFRENKSIEYIDGDSISSIRSKFTRLSDSKTGLKESITAFFDTENFEPFLEAIEVLFEENPTVFIRFTYSDLIDVSLKDGEYDVNEIHFNSKDEESVTRILFGSLTGKEAEEAFDEILQERTYMIIFDNVYGIF